MRKINILRKKVYGKNRFAKRSGELQNYNSVPFRENIQISNNAPRRKRKFVLLFGDFKGNDRRDGITLGGIDEGTLPESKYQVTIKTETKSNVHFLDKKEHTKLFISDLKLEFTNATRADTYIDFHSFKQSN